MSALTTAWQAALAGEHQAAFGYSLLGPRLTGRALALAIACSNAHEALRDRTEQALVAAGQSPVQSRADYPALYPVRTADAARALAIRLEDDCAAGWRHLYAVAAGMAADAQVTVVRHDAQSALTASAVRATRWRLVSGEARATVAFPGV